MERKWLKYERETRWAGFLIVAILVVMNLVSAVLFNNARKQYRIQLSSKLKLAAVMAREQWVAGGKDNEEFRLGKMLGIVYASGVKEMGLLDGKGSWKYSTNSYRLQFSDDPFSRYVRARANSNRQYCGLSKIVRAGPLPYVMYIYDKPVEGQYLAVIAPADFLTALETTGIILNFSLFFISGLIFVFLYFYFKSIFAPFKKMALTAKRDLQVPPFGSDVELVMDIYQRMIVDLRHNGKKLGELYDSEKERAANIEHNSRQILDNIDKGIITLKNDGTILSYNKAAEVMLGDNGIRKAAKAAVEENIPSDCLKETTAIEEHEREGGVKILLQREISDYRGIDGAIIGKIVTVSDVTTSRKLEELAEYSERAELINSATRSLLDKLTPVVSNLKSAHANGADNRQRNGYLQEIENCIRDYGRIFSLEKGAPPGAASPDIIYKSEKFKAILELTNRVASSDSTVLIEGESGTGKELIAREIHRLSSRAAGPFISLNCAALPETLLESELFGYVKGAFTGAGRDKPGLFKVAEQGSFFLDEVSELSPALQAKILRVIQEREVVPVGGVKPIKINIRLIAATNRDLGEMVEANSFRPDLYYRLNVFPISIPPLRDRKDDIEPLAMYFLRRHSVKINKSVSGFSQAALKILVQYDWPGNVRQLENAVERAVLMAGGGRIEPSDLNFISEPQNNVPGGEGDGDEGLLAASARVAAGAEKKMIHKVLVETNGNKSEAARRLKISYRVMLKKIKDYGIKI